MTSYGKGGGCGRAEAARLRLRRGRSAVAGGSVRRAVSVTAQLGGPGQALSLPQFLWPGVQASLLAWAPPTGLAAALPAHPAGPPGEQLRSRAAGPGTPLPRLPARPVGLAGKGPRAARPRLPSAGTGARHTVRVLKLLSPARLPVTNEHIHAAFSRTSNSPSSL